MRIIISPAKKMKVNTDIFAPRSLPSFIEDAEKLLDYLKSLSYEEAKALWKCSDAIARTNYERVQEMELRGALTPAVLSYEGLQYQYMAPDVFTAEAYEYVEEHLRILSGFYGMVKPFDGVTPYRLEMQAKTEGFETSSLYEFWGDRLSKALLAETDCILNLASKEYSKAVSAHLPGDIRFVTCVFGELNDGKVREKGTMAKMARGEMVRYMAENRIENIEEIKNFDRMHYVFSREKSDENTFVFIKEE